MDILKRSKFFFIISMVALISGLISLVLFGLKFSIDFTGGTSAEFVGSTSFNSSETIASTLSENKFTHDSIVSSGKDRFIVKLKPLTAEDQKKLSDLLISKGAKIESLETVGPSIGLETLKNAFLAVIVASIAILLYIAFSFSGIPSPYSSFRFGVSAIFALLHDTFLVLGLFSILGHFYHVEVNALFITALLTIMGFSVHDTIVVFDRIRENLVKLVGLSFYEVVNLSLIETLNRSLRTSLTVIITLLSLLVLGGESLRYFVLALLIGVISGTYSSIFNAAPVLVAWETYLIKKKASNKK